ncbi:MAG: AhpC/TSA family protein [Mediterranea sp.]|jgi:peroxiredoxin/predicted small secreted protein|nr:AhpC/TSA family protein [Mediterranea sp.]
MKKLTYLFVATAALLAACATAPGSGYTVTGTVEGAKDGDTVFLQELNGRKFVALDTAVITSGKFTFKGQQDSVVERYLTCKVEGQPLRIDFFLENGSISIELTKNNDVAKGTPNNDTYQLVRAQISLLNQEMQATNEAMASSELTDDARAALMAKGDSLERAYVQVLKDGARKNITNPVGIVLFKQVFYENTPDENSALLAQLPKETVKADQTLTRIKEITDKQKKTAVGTKFVDFEMPDPNGKMVKLSDYVGKGKVVLVDFWASWCPPCRREMPNLVKAYQTYKGKNFEIVGVSLDQDADAWKKGIKELGITWPQMSDVKYWNSEAAKLYAVNSIPHTILFDGEGTIIARGLHGEELNAKLAELLK